NPTSLAAGGVLGAHPPLLTSDPCGHHLLSVLWNPCLRLAIAGGVRPRPAIALIIAGAAVQGVIAAAATECVVAGPPGQRVIATQPEDAIIARRGSHRGVLEAVVPRCPYSIHHDTFAKDQLVSADVARASEISRSTALVIREIRAHPALVDRR